MMEPVLCDRHQPASPSHLNNNKWRWQQQQQRRHLSGDCQYSHGASDDSGPRARADSLSLGPRGRARAGFSHGTLPRGPLEAREAGEVGAHRLSMSSHNIADVERMYMAMKQLSSPLPGQRMADGSQRMPQPHVLPGGAGGHLSQSMESVVTSVMGDIPPPPPPVQSHAVLEFSLGHSIPVSPRTPGAQRRLFTDTWSPHKSPGLSLPPLPPKRSSSRVADLGCRPSNLNLHDTSIYSRPRLLPDRTSLMSTGSSDSGTGSTSDQDQPLSPGSGQFSWPQSSGSGGQAPSDNMSMYSEANTSMTSHSGLYVKMRPQKLASASHQPLFQGEGAEYMSLLYSAVQSQGGGGSVEAAISPYLAMSSPHTPHNPHTPAPPSTHDYYNPSLSSMSAVYDQIESMRGSRERLNTQESQVTTNTTRKRNYKALEQFRQLMVEVEHKRHFRVGLNLFNTVPDVGVDYLVKQGAIELSPLSVAKFLYKNQSLSKLKIGQYLGQYESAFCAKVLSLFLQEFDFTGLRFDKAVRKFLTYIKVPEQSDKVEKIMETFVKRFIKCNPGIKNEGQESLVKVGCSIIQLNTDIHTKSGAKTGKRLTEKDFLSQSHCQELDGKLLKTVYKSVKKKPLVSEVDHVSQVELLAASLAGPAPPQLAAPHRRLVCLCSLFQVRNINTDSEAEARSHPRVAWLFNDLLVIVKQTGKTGAACHKENIPLLGLEVRLFKAGLHKCGVQIVRKRDREIMVSLSLDTEQDQYKFVMDLQESIFEMESMHRAAKEANMIK